MADGDVVDLRTGMREVFAGICRSILVVGVEIDDGRIFRDVCWHAGRASTRGGG